MIEDTIARFLLTVLFAVLGAYYLGAAVTTVRRPGRDQRRLAVSAGLHVLLSAAMIGMCWAWGASIPVIAQVTLFTAAAGWFAGQALFGVGSPYCAGRAGNWVHAGMTAVMVWMAAATSLATATAATANSGMAGMSMGGTAVGVTSAVLPGTGSPGWAGTVSLILAIALFAGAAGQAVAALRPLAAPGRGVAETTLRDGASALMAAGMAVVLLEMA